MVDRIKTGMLGLCALASLTASVPARAESGALEQALQARIARDMRPVPETARFSDDVYGIAQVVFRVDGDGRVTQARIARRSGSAPVDHEAVRLIRSFRGLPAGNPAIDLYAVLQYGRAEDDAGAAARQRTAMTRAVTLARADADSATRTAAAQPDGSKVAARATGGVVMLAYNDPADARR